MIWPVNLNLWHTFHPISSLFEPKGILSVVVTLAFITASVYTYKKNKAMFFGFLLMALPLLPVFYIKAIGAKPFAERYLYLPSVGFVLLLAIFLSWAKVKLPHAAKSITIAFMIIVGLYAVGTVSRNTVWKDNFSLWADTVNKSPDSVDSHLHLGVAYASKGLLDMAIAEYQTALRLNPNYAEVHYDLGIGYASKGLLDMAITEYQTALHMDPDLAEAHNNLGNAYASKGLLDMAIAEYQTAIRLTPDYAAMHYNLGVAYISKGLLDMAISELQVAIRLNPDLAGAYNNLGNAYISKGLLDMAISELQVALRLNPYSPEVHYNLASVYLRQGHTDLARREAEMLLSIKPDSDAARRLLNDINSRRY